MNVYKEKAKELVTKFEKISMSISFEDAKDAAIIAIDELIIQNGEANLLFKIDKDYYQEIYGYLFQVKQEIELL